MKPFQHRKSQFVFPLGVFSSSTFTDTCSSLPHSSSNTSSSSMPPSPRPSPPQQGPCEGPQAIHYEEAWKKKRKKKSVCHKKQQ